MTPDTLAALRAPGAKGDASSGKDFGLAVSEELARNHGFRMEIRSVLGRGSCFSVAPPVQAWAGGRC